MSYHYHPLENCLVQIFYGDLTRQKTSCGTGVALLSGRVLTCAHVVKEAMQLKGDFSQMPEQKVLLNFPFSSSKNIISAKVIFWDTKADIAGLELLEEFPTDAKPATLYVADDLWGHRIQAFGFPDKYPAGTWADSKLRGANTDGWIEIVDSQVTGYYVQQGFSGGPVWDADLGCCVGIIVAADRNVTLRTSYLIPAHKIAEKWSDLPIQHKARPKPKRELPSSLVYRIDRKKQEEDLRSLYEKNNSQNPKPMVAVIHGNDRQAHDMFLERMALEFIPELLKVNLAHTPITRISLQWPTYIQKIEDLGDKLTQGLADRILHTVDSSCEDIQRTLSAYPGPVVIEMELLTDDWMKHKTGVLEAILNFWNGWPTLANRQHLFVFLYVTHKNPPTN
ncbi:MAG TPA: trypsin-like peptidase domain-containing protein [Anaerolineales bacterium]|nr:trypsin-like peptidase domain-containing protein [Anaerolineales bacterium]